jgi:hypothetical protein
MRIHTKRLTALLALCLSIALSGVASAQSIQSGDDGYVNRGENVAGQVQGGSQGGGGGGGESGTPVAAAETSGGSLPFTGVDLALIVGVGGLLLAVGLGTRRVTRHADAA